ncbi:hypothetical protein KIPE111705_07875 [Kibdelosporangium persicum]|uniref:Uncharacterized protein n=1 Tax=Kibdelosporangium persicum TaxID=2698649 RepID=A0ABX2F3C3_9PSEU|nr:hypothetical protein [Kibdelosporangium persicum]NRN65340.1 hypothetical protein [Kibdelosporangium persicum]
MPERGEPAQPGMVPGVVRTAGTMFAALYGELVPHAWLGAEPVNDAYSLFHRRSQAMGWLDVLWGMNDAGWHHRLAGLDSGLVSWFQVEANAVAADRPLPVQPFLRCAVDATARAGTVNLSAVQVLLPVQGLDASSRPAYARVPSLATAQWFAERDAESAVPVQVSANSGQDPSVPAVAEHLMDLLGRQDVFVCESFGVAGEALAPPFDDGFWNGPPAHGVVLRGELAEWSCDAIGWLAEVVADSASQLGVRSPLLVTVTRARPMS